MKQNLRILLSRTDSIGDVILTLPMAGWIKQHFPTASVFFLGRTYTKEIVALSEHVDGFVNYDDLLKLSQEQAAQQIRDLQLDVFLHVFPQSAIAKLAKAAKVPLRVGTTNRLYHWLTCNKLIRLSRKNSNLHEAQLNIKLLSFLLHKTDISLSEMASLYGFTKIPSLAPEFAALIPSKKTTVILHPRSKGSAREWGLNNFSKLIERLPAEKFQIFISGTQQDAESMPEFLQTCNALTQVTDITGKMNLQQFVAFIFSCDALVAASTGPLHIAAALNKKAIGLFSSRRPIHPGRWAPLGAQAVALVNDQNCTTCAAGKECDCITRILPQRVADELQK
jgi:ADP-heptose:LPS heptosyltransferase